MRKEKTIVKGTDEYPLLFYSAINISSLFLELNQINLSAKLFCFKKFMRVDSRYQIENNRGNKVDAP